MTLAVEPSHVMSWRGPIAAFMRDPTRLIDLEGAFRSGKTTACLWKVLRTCDAHPGMHWLICRYSDRDTRTILKPMWREVLAAAGVVYRWNSRELCDELPGGTRIYIFGLKAVDKAARYAKFRGLTLGGIYNDQTEELPHDVFLELAGRLSQVGVPQQALFSPNPADENHWLSKTEFPADNRIADRKYYSLSVYDNAHNLALETIRNLERLYPPGHAKHRSALLGLRGLNVIGTPVYAGYFQRALHVRACPYNPHLPLYEAIDFGKHHPAIVWAQFPATGGIEFLGGLVGQDLFLEDFAPLALQYRQQWFPRIVALHTCCDPAGTHNNSQGVRLNGLQVLKQYGFAPVWKPNSNAPDVRLAMIERLGAYMRRRTATGEAFGIERDRAKWLRLSAQGVDEWAFLADGFEAGYVWSEHVVSVGSKQLRQAFKDGWYEHGQNAAEYLELNFGSAQLTEVEKAAEARREEQRQKDRAAARGLGPSGADSWMG